MTPPCAPGYKGRASAARVTSGVAGQGVWEWWEPQVKQPQQVSWGEDDEIYQKIRPHFFLLFS